MADKKRTWADRQILWGWIFLISMTVFFFYLLFTIWLPRLSDAEPSTSGIDLSTPILDDSGMPIAKVTALAQAEATLRVASEQPVQAASSVREAAQTVMAVTVESFQTPAVNATAVASAAGSVDGATDESISDGDGSAAPGLGWADWVLNAIPALTAILSFVGLVFTSIMKWRSDLQDLGHDSVGYERERLQLEMQKQRFELERIHQETLLEQQRQELALERERLQLARQRQESELEPESTVEPSLDQPNTASIMDKSNGASVVSA